MIPILRLALPLILLLGVPQESKQGVVLLKNGHRIRGEIEILDGGVLVRRPHGLNGQQEFKNSEIRYCNPDSIVIPKDMLEEGDWRPEDEARQEWDEEYRLIQKALEPVIGITRQKLARIRKKEDELLRKREYRNDILGFRVRPPKGWRAEQEGNLVTFTGTKKLTMEPRIHVVSMSVPGVAFEDLVSTYEQELKAHHGAAALSWLRFPLVSKTDQKQWALSFIVDRGDLKIKTRRFLVMKESRVYILTLYTDIKEDERNRELFRIWKDTFVIIK